MQEGGALGPAQVMERLGPALLRLPRLVPKEGTEFLHASISGLLAACVPVGGSEMALPIS